MIYIQYTVLDDESGNFHLDVIPDGLINFDTGTRYVNYEK
jgi:hypothetical protein